MASDQRGGAAAAADPEAEFLASERRTGDEWERFKENVRPLKRGRNVDLLNSALSAHRRPLLRKALVEQRRRMIDAIDEYEGEDPLLPWIECIMWVQESFPAAGEYSGLMVIYEQCVRSFWHDELYKNDLRYLKVWLEYAENCYDAEIIYRFLEANEIGQNYASFYTCYALHLEAKNKLNKADEIFNLGIHRKAQPLGKLEDKYQKFIIRLSRRDETDEEERLEDQRDARMFGTLLSRTENGNRTAMGDQLENDRKKAKLQRPEKRTPLSIFNDNALAGRNSSEIPRKEPRIWNDFGTQRERNKENTSIPTKWTSFKVPQNTASRPVPPVARINVFVDEECAELPATSKAESVKPASLLKRANSQSLKRDSELLKGNPLRNFPPNSLPR